MPKEISYFFTKSDIIFEVGGKQYTIPRGRFQALVDSAKVADEFDRQLTEADDCAYLNTRDYVALFDWLRGQGFPESTIAGSMNITLEKLRTWTTEHAEAIEGVRKTYASDIERIKGQHDKARPEGLQRVLDGRRG